MNQSHNLNGFPYCTPLHVESFDQNSYFAALLRGYSDEEAYQIGSAQPNPSGFAETRYRYPDPESLTVSMQEDRYTHLGNSEIDTRGQCISLEANSLEIACHEASMKPASQLSSLKDLHRGTEQNADIMSTLEHDDSIRYKISLTPELMESPVALIGMPSLKTSPDTSVSSSPSSAILPDTYAGRRSAHGRSNFPRECAACGKRFLYEDSALKHYRRHHGESPDIILRWDAPKRPPPGLPRNIKAARSRARHSSNPPAPTTASLSVPGQVYDDLLSLHDSSSPRTSESPAPSPSNSTYKIDGMSERSSPDVFGSAIGNSLHRHIQHTVTRSRPQHLISGSLVNSQSQLAYTNDGGQYNNLNDNLLLNPELKFPSHDARYAAIQARQMLSSTFPETAQEAIVRANPHLLQRRLARPKLIEKSIVTDAKDESPRNISYLSCKASTGEHPPLPPDWAYDNNDTSLTFHPQFGSYYRRTSSGIWQRWCADTSSWE